MFKVSRAALLNSLFEACRSQTAFDCLKTSKRIPPLLFKLLVKSNNLFEFQSRKLSARDREPIVDIVMMARHRRWNWLRHVLSPGQVLMVCVKPTLDSILGEVLDLYSRNAVPQAFRAFLASSRENAENVFHTQKFVGNHLTAYPSHCIRFSQDSYRTRVRTGFFSKINQI